MQHFTFLYPVLPDIRKSIVLFEVYQSPPACPSDNSNIRVKMGVEQWWSYTERREEVYWDVDENY